MHFFSSIKETHQALQAREISAAELTQSFLKRIAALDPHIQAFITVAGEQALAQAQEIDQKLAAGDELPILAGIPMSLKDLFTSKGVQTTAGSKMLAGYIPPFDATVVARLRAQGMVLLGKNTEDEFGHGATSEHTGYNVPHNPWDLARIAGGSSGGSAAAVSAGVSHYSLGTDTGGSIRQPASMCGIVGLKPTYGRVSRYGVISMASSLDTIGCLTRSVEDAAYVMQTLAGPDPFDATTPPQPVPDYLASLSQGADLQGVRIGVPKEYFVAGLASEVAALMHAAIDQLKSLGAEVKEVSLPHSKYGCAAYYIICPSEVSSNMARYDGVAYGPAVSDAEDLLDFYLKNRRDFHEEVKRRIMIGTYALSSGYYDAYYLKAQKIRTLVKQDFDEVFADVDVIAAPTSPSVATKIGENDDPLACYLMDMFTIPASLAGVCGISLPCGFSQNLPVGLQLIGKQFGEADILQVGHAYQQVTDWHRQHPSLEFSLAS